MVAARWVEPCRPCIAIVLVAAVDVVVVVEAAVGNDPNVVRK